MKIAFNPSTVAALITPPNNKDITFDLRGRNIFARGVKFCGTDTNTWRDIKINNVSIGSNTLDLRNGSNTTLTNTNGVVTINSTWRPVVDNLTSDSTTSSLSANQGRVLAGLINSKSDSEHNHDDRYLRLTGGTMQLGEGLKFHADNNYFGTDSDARIISLLDGNDKVCDGGLIIDERGTLDGKEYVTELLRIRDSEFKWKGSNILHSGNSYINGNTITINNSSISVSKSAHTHSWTSITDKLVAGNEFNIVNAGFNSDMYFNYLPINDRNSTAYINSYIFGNGHRGLALVQASGFAKTGSSDSYVLLGGGGHQTISSLSVNYANSAGNADTLDGTHLNGLLTSVSNVNNGISVTVGGITKSVSNISVNQAVISNVADLLDSHDERINQYYPYEVPKGIRLRFQNNGNNGLNSGGYYGLLSWRSYGNGNDLSGGYPFQIAYLQSGDLCTRVGTSATSWSPWRKLAYTSDFNWTNLPDKIVGGNEFNIVNAGFNNQLWFNYLPVDNRNSSAAISQYNMGNGNKGLASVYAYRFKADGKSCMWKDARNYAPFYSTFEGGFEPILDIKTVSGDWSIGSYDSYGNYLVFAFTSDSDYNAGRNGTAQYYITTDGTFSGASRYINHTPGDPQSYMHSTSTGTYDGAIQIREVNEVLNTQSAWGYAPRITFHWGQRYAKGFGMRSDGQFAVDDIPIALTSNVLTFSNESTDYLNASFNNPDFSKKAASKYIECWDGEGGWWNWMAGKFMKAGSSDAYVLLGGGGHKPLSEFQLGNGSYLPYNGWWSSGSGQDVNDANGMIFAYANHKNSPFSSAWGIITTFDYTYNSAYKFQLAANGYSNAMYYRSRSSDRGGWTSWAQVIDTGNISSQRVAYATSAGSVAWGSITGKPSSFTPSAHDHNYVLDIGNNTHTTLAYSKPGLSKDSITWLAVWNGYELRAMNKDQIALAGHTHDDRYLKLAGGTMNGNARISHDKDNLYIGRADNYGWVMTQDIASQSGADKWYIKTSGASCFGNIHIANKTDGSFNSSVIECTSTINLNYFSSQNVSLCNGGGTVQIGSYTTGDTGNNKLYVNGSEFINGASNVRDHVFANGFRHRSHNSNDSVLLAGGGYSQGVPVRYWAIYYMYIGGSSTDVTYTKRSGNYDFITSKEWDSEGVVLLNISFPSGYNKNNTLIFGSGDHRTSSSWKTPVYVTITTSPQFGWESKIRVMMSDDASLNTGFANIYFMCMG